MAASALTNGLLTILKNKQRVRKKSFAALRAQYNRVAESIKRERLNSQSSARVFDLVDRDNHARLAYGKALQARGMHYGGRNMQLSRRNPEIAFGAVAG